jgi:hypothetical protein
MFQRLDGAMVDKVQRKNKLSEAPMDFDLDEGIEDDDGDEHEYQGPVCETQLTDITNMLAQCFEKPSICNRTLKELEVRARSQLLFGF